MPPASSLSFLHRVLLARVRQSLRPKALFSEGRRPEVVRRQNLKSLLLDIGSSNLWAKNFDRNTGSCASWVRLVHLSLIPKCSVCSRVSESALGLAGFPPTHPQKYISYVGSNMSWGGEVIGGRVFYLRRPGAVRAP